MKGLPSTTGRRPASAAVRTALAVGSLALFAIFMALGTWQVERRAWKHELIARVNQRVSAPPVAAPDSKKWPLVNANDDEYRHVLVTGHFVQGQQTLVQAVTVLGSGFWVMTPLREADGTTVLINRGFIPAEARDRIMVAQTGQNNPTIVPKAVTVFGLLRMTEPGGGFLRHNDAATNRWFSRDVAAIAAAHGITNVAPYFVDAAAAASTTSPSSSTAAADEAFVSEVQAVLMEGVAPAVKPIGGLTVISFHDSHLVYAITWYALALMVAGAAWYLRQDDKRLRSFVLTDDFPNENRGGVNGGRVDATDN